MAFGRVVVLRIGTPGSDGREFTGLRIDFDVDCTESGTPNEGKIKLWNANDESIALAQEAESVVRLYAGYADEAPRLVFAGEPIEGGVQVESRTRDTILTIEAQDGGREYRSAYLDESYNAETTIEQFAALAADAMGLSLGTFDLGDADPRLPTMMLSGPVREQLRRVAGLAGLVVTTRDRALHVYPSGSSSGESAIIFRSGEGSSNPGNLVGSPIRRDEGRVEIRALLAPTLRPGRPFRVVSRYVNGDFVAEDVSFRGSTHGRDFYVEAIGRPR